MNHPLISLQPHRDTRLFEFFRVGLALIAERIALGGLDECCRKAAQIRLQRRNIRMAAFLR